MKGKSYILHTPTALGNAVKWLASIDDSKLPLKLTLEKYVADHTDPQRKKMYAMIDDVRKHVKWDGEYRSKDAWKWLFSGSLKKQELVPGIDGGWVALGLSTKDMDKEFVSTMIELIYAFGAEREVPWSEKSRHEV